MDGLVIGVCILITVFFAYQMGRTHEQQRFIRWLREDMEARRVDLDYIDLMIQRLD